MTSKRILIVEDAMDVGRMLQSSIQTLNAGYTVTWMRSAEEAILETSRHKLDLVVTDIRLPGIDGFELIRRIRRRLPEVKVIVVSGLAEHELRKQVSEIKPTAVLAKPVQVGLFLEQVQAALAEGDLPPATAEQKPAPAVKPASSALPAKLTDVLARLQRDAQSQTVLLLDAEGVLAADIGAPQGGMAVESKKIKDVLAAAANLARTGHISQMLVRGAQGDWVLQLVGAEFTLAVLIPPGLSLLRLALVLEEVQKAHAQLAVSFGTVVAQPTAPKQRAEEPPAAIQSEEPPAAAAAPTPQAAQPEPPVVQPETPVAPAPEPVKEPEPVPEDPAALEAFAALFGQPEAKPVALDADSFWEEAAQSSGNVSVNPHAITFDEAQKLGLSPDEGDDKSG